MRFAMDNSADPTKWTAPITFYDSQKPVFGQIVPSTDNLNNHWVFFGSGRYFSTMDKTSTETQRLYGIKDFEDDLLYPVVTPSLLNVTDAELYTDGSLQNQIRKLDGSFMTEFEEIEEEIDDNASGWFLDLPPIVGIAGAVPSTRNTTRSALAGGALFTSVFQPSDDPCAGEGRSRLYGMYYKTGTAYPSIPPIFTSSTTTVGGEVKYLSNRFVDLGRGAGTTPTLHSGSGSGNSSVQVFSQLSTGEMVQTEAETVLPIRSGRTSWRDQ
jgi:type IV pilus assembly protein PilY1